MVCKTNAKRDAVIISIAIILCALFIEGDRYFYQRRKIQQEAALQEVIQGAPSEEQISEEVQKIQKTIDITNWKLYQNQYYGFEVKYPQDWAAPKSQAAVSGSQWEYRYQFRKNSEDPNNPYLGFDVVIYNVAKTKELSGTDEFPTIKSEDLKNNPECANIEGHSIDTGDYPAAEIYIPPTDDCYNPVLFFSFIRDQYIYNFVPVLKEGSQVDSDPRIAIDNNFPEFLSVISTADLIDVVRPKPTPPKPKITAPFPVSYKVVNGQLVCAKKNDHPSKSKQHKGKHLDMECCLDPDEYPNPHCYYSPDKYGKYL